MTSTHIFLCVSAHAAVLQSVLYGQKFVSVYALQGILCLNCKGGVDAIIVTRRRHHRQVKKKQAHPYR